MCGIAGFFHHDRNPVEHPSQVLNRMIGMLRHRGPDGNGFHMEPGLGFAHARLSIIDLAGGNQPMCNEDGTIWITFNGEIFNYLELRETLVKNGHQFATKCDTEVILHLYEDKGEDCVNHLNGQWSFAIWDSRKRRLFLSRDRMGVRPLFYTFADGAFVFASEIKSIFAYPNIRRELDLQALDQVFTYWFSLPPRTMFQGVSELPPGHSVIVENGVATVRQYWNLDYSGCALNGDALSEREYADRLLELLIDSTRIRLRSDVPVGAYLSGGLDSTITTALIRKFTSAPLRTFSVRFDDPEFDESAYQQEAVRYLDTDHEEVICRKEDIGQVFPDVVWHTEKPLVRTGPAPLFLLSRLVRQNGYKVVLTGEGSDEILGGYDIFKEAKIRRFWGMHPDSKFRPLLLRRLYPYLTTLQSQPASYLQRFFQVNPDDLNSPFFSHLPRWQLASRLRLFFSPDVRGTLQSRLSDMESQLPAAYSDWHWFCKAQYLESAYLLPGYILSSQGDRVAMAHSVEGRFPFLDYRVVEFGSRVPPTLKMKVLKEKYLLKQCVNGLIPPSVKARYKQPYRAPEAKSFFANGGLDYANELLSPQQIRRDNLFDPSAVDRLVAKARQGRDLSIADNMALVGILSTQLVANQFLRSFPKL